MYKPKRYMKEIANEVSITWSLTLELPNSQIDFAQFLCRNFKISSVEILNNHKRNGEQAISMYPVVPAS